MPPREERKSPLDADRRSFVQELVRKFPSARWNGRSQGRRARGPFFDLSFWDAHRTEVKEEIAFLPVAAISCLDRDHEEQFQSFVLRRRRGLLSF